MYILVKDLKALAGTEEFIFLDAFHGNFRAQHSHFLGEVSFFGERECHGLGIYVKSGLETVKKDVIFFVDVVGGDGDVIWYFGGDVWT